MVIPVGSATTSSGIGSLWVRRRYFVQDDYIRPVIGSTTETYFPFDYYYPPGSPSVRKDEMSLYLELAGLKLQDFGKIEQFTEKWGLLGIYHHRLVRVNHWRRVESEEGKPNAGQRALLVGSGPGNLFGFTRLSRENFVTPNDERTAVVAQGPFADDHVERELAEYSAKFFPGIFTEAVREGAEAEFLQALCTPELFWDHLSEPLWAFVEVASRFQQAYRLAVAWQGGDRSENLRTELAKALEEVFVNTRPRAGFMPGETDRWTQLCDAPSLLSVCYRMLWLDLSESRNQRICASETCGKPFVSQRSDKLFCCDTCGNREYQRERRRDEQRLKAEGEQEDEREQRRKTETGRSSRRPTALKRRIRA